VSPELAAIAAVVVLAGLVCFQLALAAGRPFGRYAWGGAHTVLPRGLRIASALATVVYVLAAVAILEAAGVTDLVASAELPRTITWVLAGLFGIGTVMNAVSRSTKERRMAAVALVLAVLAVIVARDSS
jgi:hypothetical protein